MAAGTTVTAAPPGILRRPPDRRRRPRGVRASRPRWSAVWSYAAAGCCASSGPVSGSTGCSSAVGPCRVTGVRPAGRSWTVWRPRIGPGTVSAWRPHCCGPGGRPPPHPRRWPRRRPVGPASAVSQRPYRTDSTTELLPRNLISSPFGPCSGNAKRNATPDRNSICTQSVTRIQLF